LSLKSAFQDLFWTIRRFPQTVFRPVCLPGNSILRGTGYNCLNGLSGFGAIAPLVEELK
jgi:hypothetical protein